MESSCNDSRDNGSELHSTDDDDAIIEHEHIGGTYKLRDSRYLLFCSMNTDNCTQKYLQFFLLLLHVKTRKWHFDTFLCLFLLPTLIVSELAF